MDQFAGEGETHVAQKSRRDKLRGNIAASPDFHHRSSSLVQLMSGDVMVDPAMFSSHQALGLHQNPSLQTPTDLFMAAAAQTRQNFGSWKRVFSSSSPNSDWAVKCDSDGISDSSSNHGFLSTPASVTPPPPPLPFGSSQPNIPTAVPWLFDGCQDYNTNGSELALLPATNISPPRINNATPVWLPSDLTANHDCCSSTTQNRLSLTLSSNPTHPPLPVHPHSSSDVLRGTGPLGPFTGYATILKSSKYLKPAQMLLDECCGSAIAGSFPINSLSSLSSRSSVNANHNGCGNGPDNSTGACHTRLQEKKSKLLLMQSEVSRSFKHYNQQIQMAISSFKSVGGLSAAMPFLKASVKSITKYFRFLRGVISDQLLTVGKNLSEEEVRSVDHVESSSGMKFMDQALLRRNTEESSALGGFVKNQTRTHNHSHNQAAWKPQRGLPERAVAVLRAWLFDHFLHPYPTDTDKLMLATQTGLSRNQVSNWFINARVRVWKPMVEEIHMLDTKGLAKMDLNSSTNTDNQHNYLAEVQSGVLESESAVADAGVTGNLEQWVVPDQNKRARIGVDSGELTTIFSGYPCVGDGGGGGFDMGELGLVSLTLGLRQEEANQRDEQMRAYFGTQLVREYVG